MESLSTVSSSSIITAIENFDEARQKQLDNWEKVKRHYINDNQGRTGILWWRRDKTDDEILNSNLGILHGGYWSLYEKLVDLGYCDKKDFNLIYPYYWRNMRNELSALVKAASDPNGVYLTHEHCTFVNSFRRKG